MKLDEIKSLKLQRHQHIIVSRAINLYYWEGWKLFCFSSIKVSSVIIFLNFSCCFDIKFWL